MNEYVKMIAKEPTSKIKLRFGVLTQIKNSLNFTGRELPDDDAVKFEACKAELERRA